MGFPAEWIPAPGPTIRESFPRPGEELRNLHLNKLPEACRCLWIGTVFREMHPKLFPSSSFPPRTTGPAFLPGLLVHQQHSPDCLVSLLEARGGWSLRLGDISGGLNVLPLREQLQVSGAQAR